MKKKNKPPRVGGGHPENPLQQARIRAGVSQEKVAEVVSCDPRTIQRYEAGEQFPTQEALLKIFSGYRKQRYIEEIMVFPNGTGYYVCPRCHITLEREFVAYCDRCGQHLGWKGYRKARIIRPKLPYPAGTGMLLHGDR